VEEPPEEAADPEVSELNPLISELCGVNAEVREYEGGDDDGCEEADVEGVD
jgi:hypothetical protein